MTPATDNRPSERRDVDLSTATILVVDSKALFRDMVRSAFMTRARAVREATSVDKAIEILSRNGAGIHCVVCDWDIVPTGGLELLRMIRARTLRGISARLPVVVLTARADADAVKTAMELDVNGFVVTPVSLDKLIDTVSGALARDWILQEPSHYASVHGIVPPARPLEIALVPPSPRAPHFGRAFSRRDTSRSAESARALRNVRMCILDDVNPGSFLARDLRDRDGRLLAPSGTELKLPILQRLKNVSYALSDSYCVWIGER